MNHKCRPDFTHGGFTLIELLIVIAIISILSMIAVPNFLDAQSRAKIARVHADERTIATAIESYFVDYGIYPYYYNANDGTQLNYSDHDGERTFVPYRLTTPVAYITTLPISPFQPGGWTATDPPTQQPFTYFYRYYWGLPAADWVNYPGPGTRDDNRMYDKDQATKAQRVNWCYDCYNHKSFFVDQFAASQIVLWMVASCGPGHNHCEAIERAMEPQYYHVGARDPSWPDLRYDPTNGTVSIGDILRFNAQSQ
ncbi:MAG: prepilin-type N-terminal cleavage/methylation domain-containing protein [Candidatus Sumerlaeota bacterium]|nr:prepilin-type N-terminal cleavage/methylation domain-containing protein [Candidatus Sumerlaeota bacterium]